MLPFNRVLHLTWKQVTPPRLLQSCIDSFRIWNPHWKIRFYTDTDCEDFVRNHCSEWEDLYFAYPPGIYRADIFRLLVLLHEGGVYADIDIECRRPLDELIDNHAKGDDWELLLTTDHPIHERIHFKGRRIYMNDFMVARQGASFLEEVLKKIRKQAESRRKGNVLDPGNAVFETGPVVFTQVIEDAGSPENYRIRVVPWQSIHPLPDMSCQFPEHREWESSILSGSWRDRFDPYVVHYWYHTWCKGGSMLEHYSKHLLQSRGEYVESRLQKFVPYLGKRIQTTGRALTEFAERGSGLVVELGVTRSFVSADTEGVSSPDPRYWDPNDPARWDWGAGSFTRVASETLIGLNHRYLGIDPHEDALAIAQQVSEGFWETGTLEWRCEVASKVLKTLEPHEIGLLYMDHGESSEEAAKLHEADARLVIGKDILRPGGLVLIDDHRPDDKLVPKSKYSREVFEDAGYEVLEEGYQLLLRRPIEKELQIPRLLHWFPDSSENAFILPEALGRQGWKCRVWSAEAIMEFLSDDGEAFVDIINSFGANLEKQKVVRLLVLAHYGGIVISDGQALVDSTQLEDLLQGRRLIFCARPSGESSVQIDESSDALSLNLLASEAAHPFWIGLKSALMDAIRKVYDTEQVNEEPLDRSRPRLADFQTEVFLTKRLRICPWFLKKGDYPEVVSLDSL